MQRQVSFLGSRRVLSIFDQRQHHVLTSTKGKSKSNAVFGLAVKIPHHGCRKFSVDALPAVLLPPVVFTGLTLTLWAYKCLMIVIFQNKIIYMPGIPPFSRSEKLEDYSNRCRPVIWQERTITTTDRVNIKVLIGDLPYENSATPNGRERHVITVYFQG